MTVARFDPKPFCPCDVDRPQDCSPEKWPGAHAEAICLECGKRNYEHGYRQRIETPEGDIYALMCSV